MSERFQVKTYFSKHREYLYQEKPHLKIDSNSQELFNGLYKLYEINLDELLSKIKFVIKADIVSIKMGDYGEIILDTCENERYIMTMLDADDDSTSGCPQLCIYLDGTSKLTYIDLKKDFPVVLVEDVSGDFTINTFRDEVPEKDKKPNEPETYEHLRITFDVENVDITFDGYDLSNHDKIVDAIEDYANADSDSDIVKWLIKTIGRVPKYITILKSNNYYGDEYEEIIEIVDCKIDYYSIYHDQDDEGNDICCYLNSNGDYGCQIGQFRVEVNRESNVTQLVPGRKKNPIPPQEILNRIKFYIKNLKKKIYDFNSAFENE